MSGEVSATTTSGILEFQREIVHGAVGGLQMIEGQALSTAVAAKLKWRRIIAHLDTDYGMGRHPGLLLRRHGEAVATPCRRTGHQADEAEKQMPMWRMHRSRLAGVPCRGNAKRCSVAITIYVGRGFSWPTTPV